MHNIISCINKLVSKPTCKAFAYWKAYQPPNRVCLLKGSLMFVRCVCVCLCFLPSSLPVIASGGWCGTQAALVFCHR